MKRWLGILFGILAIIALAGYFWFANPQPSAPEFADQKPSPNIASMIKERQNDKPPNVIILLADDLGWADVGFHGSDIRTPNIDRLAKEGMRLERFYVMPICTPTRSALMTGRDPIKLGMANAGIMPWNDGGMSLDEHFMPESFQAAGYETAMVGKWHLGHTIEQHTPNARGFDHFYGHLNTNIHYFDHEFAGGHDFQENGKSVRHDGEYLTDVHGDQAVRYISELRDKEKPFFLYVPFLAPHSPMNAKEEDIAKYPRRLDLPNAPRKTYAAMVDSMDQAIGRILDTLDKQGIADNTIVLFFSDNGGFPGFGADNTPLRGGKTETFEGGIRVPTVLRWPEVIPAGTLNTAAISVLDLLPTLASATGVSLENNKALDGVNRWDAVKGQGENWRGQPLYFTTNSPIYNRFMHGVLDDRWKLVQTIDHQRRDTSVETMLFDVKVDPSETTNIADKHPGQVKRLTKLLDARLAQHPVGGVVVQLMPHPGWRAPKDYADAVIPADKIQDEAYVGFGERSSQVLQERYGGKGKILYD